jgi:prepilin-type N-terminal cleavage/methylation domain-containing protein
MTEYRDCVPPSMRRAHGFTLLELMIAVIIAALLVGLALPSFRELTIRNTSSELSNQLVLAIQTARSEAVRRGTWVEVVSVSGTNNWSSGWSVVADVDFDHQFTTDATTGTVTTASAAPTNYRVCTTSSGTSGIGGNGLIVFGPGGSLAPVQTSFDINVNRPDGKTSMVQHISVTGSGEVKSYRGTTTGAPTSC